MAWEHPASLKLAGSWITICLSAEIAQLVEHATENRGVASSILALGTFLPRRACSQGLCRTAAILPSLRIPHFVGALGLPLEPRHPIRHSESVGSSPPIDPLGFGLLFLPADTVGRVAVRWPGPRPSVLLKDRAEVNPGRFPTDVQRRARAAEEPRAPRRACRQQAGGRSDRSTAKQKPVGESGRDESQHEEP